MRPVTRFLASLGVLLWISASVPLAMGAAGAGPPAEPGGPAVVPMDPPSRARRLELPERDRFAKPEEVTAALHLLPGQVVGDVGTGTGYYARRMARAVGPEGRVYAVDAEPYMIEEVKRLARAEGLTNIVPILAPRDNSLLPEASCDLVFLASVYNSFDDRAAYLRHLITRLKPGGRIAVIGTLKGVTGHGGPVESRRFTARQVADELEAAGFIVQQDLKLLDDKYFLIAALPN